MLFTEDWFGDGMSWQWSYYGALMSSATQLAAKHDGTRDFGGYVCLRGADALGLGGMSSACTRRNRPELDALGLNWTRSALGDKDPRV